MMTAISPSTSYVPGTSLRNLCASVLEASRPGYRRPCVIWPEAPCDSLPSTLPIGLSSSHTALGFPDHIKDIPSSGSLHFLIPPLGAPFPKTSARLHPHLLQVSPERSPYQRKQKEAFHHLAEWRNILDSK